MKSNTPDYGAVLTEDQEKSLWEELKLLQDIISKFDGFTFQIKSWFVAIFIAVIGYSFSPQVGPAPLILNYLIILMFYMYEITYRYPHREFLRRSREIQQILRGETPYGESSTSPNLDKYLLDTSSLGTDSRCSRVLVKLGVEEERSKRNAVEYRVFRKRVCTLIFQLRVSLLYLFAVLINSIALLILCAC